jgi:hypothetical protein
MISPRHHRAFNKVWNAKLEAKRVVEADAEKAAKAKAKEDMSNWTTQRDIRLHAKKVVFLRQLINLVRLPYILAACQYFRDILLNYFCISGHKSQRGANILGVT